METTAIATKGLTKSYGRVSVVDHLDLRVTTGTVHGLLGPNGSGKSTTMKMLLGLVTPTSGEMTVLGQQVNHDNRAHALARVGALIEQPAAYLHLTGAENLAIAARLVDVPQRNIDWAVGLVRMENQMNKLVKNYSLGMKQRLGLAMALLRDPHLLILDEPTNGLDPAGIEEIRDLIVSLASEHGRTVLVSSHLLSEIEKMASELTIINQGRLLYQGSKETLFDAQQPDVFIETPAVQQARDLTRHLLPRVTEKGIEIPRLARHEVADVCAYLVSHDVPIHQVVRQRQSLEDIFIGLTGREALSV